MKYYEVFVVFNEASEPYVRKARWIKLPLRYGVANGEMMWRNEDDDSAPHRIKLSGVHHFECEDKAMYDRLSCSGVKVYDHILGKDEPDYYDQVDNVIDSMYEGCDDKAGAVLHMLDLLTD